jgi:hypothetical protein
MKISGMKFAAALLLLLLAGVWNFQAMDAGHAVSIQPVAGGPRAPVLVELFTSEGCSSCPPADALLGRLHAQQPVEGVQIVAIKMHVDYWNRLGWSDPFSSGVYTARQHRYAESFGNDSVYTPQMVVDGKTEFVGSSERRARNAIVEASLSTKAEAEISLAGEAEGKIILTIRLDPLGSLTPGDTAEVFLALTEDNLTSSIRSGENAGLTIRHEAVARTLLSVGRIRTADSSTAFSTKATVPVSREWKRENLRAVVFVQEIGSRRVRAIGTLGLAPGMKK